MNHKQLACYYSVMRFCPYPETDEFVNVGVVLSCPAIGLLDFKRARRLLARVNNFFPELDPQIFSKALQSLNGTLSTRQQINTSAQLLTDEESRRQRDDFFALVRPRETILFFSEPRVILSDTPSNTLEILYATYVNRQFAQPIEYQEKQMCRRLEALLKTHQLLETFERDRPVGDDRYRVHFPFVRFEPNGQTAQRAIKALYLDKEEPTDIFQHADRWRNNVCRLRDFQTVPHEMLFVLHPPLTNNKPGNRDAFDRVLADFTREAISVTLEDKSDQVLAFAQL